MLTFNGLRLIYSMHALKEGTVRTFPVSKNRSRRIHKKLCKRFGGEFRKEPCIWKTPDAIIAHPSFKSQIERALEAV